MSDELTAETRAQAMVSRWIGTYTVSNAGTVQHMMVEVDTVAEIAAAIRSAEMAQMERDCAVVCEWCNHAPGYESAHMKGGEWFHRWRSISHAGVAYCAASPIRAAYAERQKEGAE